MDEENFLFRMKRDKKCEIKTIYIPHRIIEEITLLANHYEFSINETFRYALELALENPKMQKHIEIARIRKENNEQKG